MGITAQWAEETRRPDAIGVVTLLVSFLGPKDALLIFSYPTSTCSLDTDDNVAPG